MLSSKFIYRNSLHLPSSRPGKNIPSSETLNNWYQMVIGLQLRNISEAMCRLSRNELGSINISHRRRRERSSHKTRYFPSLFLFQPRLFDRKGKMLLRIGCSETWVGMERARQHEPRKDLTANSQPGCKHTGLWK